MSKNDEPDFSHSLTDLWTSLAVVFLILAVGMVINVKVSESDSASKFTEYQVEREKIYDNKILLLDKLNKIFELDKHGTDLSTNSNCITIDGNSSPYKILIKFNSEDPGCKDKGLFYDTAVFQLQKNEHISHTINSITKIYHEICSEHLLTNIDDVQILGHTDTEPAKMDVPACNKSDTYQNSSFQELHCGNLFLSAQRARDVFLLIGQTIISENDGKLFDCFKSKTEISGRGPFKPEGFIVQGAAKKESNQRRVERDNNYKQTDIK